MASQGAHQSQSRIRIVLAVTKVDNSTIVELKGIPTSLTVMCKDIIGRKDIHAFLQSIFRRTLNLLELDISQQARLCLSIISNKREREYVDFSINDDDFASSFTNALNNHAQALTGVLNLPCLHICFPIAAMLPSLRAKKITKDSGTLRVRYLDIGHITDDVDLDEHPTSATIALLDAANKPLRLMSSGAEERICRVSHVTEEDLKYDVFAIEDDLALCQVPGMVDRPKFLMPVSQLDLDGKIILYYNQVPHADKDHMLEIQRPRDNSRTRGVAQKKKPLRFIVKRDQVADEESIEPDKKTVTTPQETVMRRPARKATQAKPKLQEELDRQALAGVDEDTDDHNTPQRTCGRCNKAGTQDQQSLMVRCDGVVCRGTEFYHIHCVSLSRLPKSSFFCWYCCQKEAPKGRCYKEPKNPQTDSGKNPIGKTEKGS